MYVCWPLLYAFIVVDLARVRAHTHVVLAFERFELDGWQLIHLGDIAHLRSYSLGGFYIHYLFY